MTHVRATRARVTTGDPYRGLGKLAPLQSSPLKSETPESCKKVHFAERRGPALSEGCGILSSPSLSTGLAATQPVPLRLAAARLLINTVNVSELFVGPIVRWTVTTGLFRFRATHRATQILPRNQKFHRRQKDDPAQNRTLPFRLPMKSR